MTVANDRRTIGTALAAQIALAAAFLWLQPRFAIANLHPAAGALLCGAAAGALLYLVAARGALPSRTAFVARLPSLLLKGGLVTVVAWAEETLWRGVAFGNLEARGTVLALGLTTVCFAAAHVFGQGWPAFRPHLLTGLTFGALFVLTGSLAAAIAAHATYNLFVVAADHGLRNARRGDANLQGLSPC
ncbi:MAG TPA: CPBP family intramembrane glutamic endopeptidase [Candidatus Elarobacter sp.]|nr:CPBP family intramembrane glutamic endopeptidase [Dongiaceae bacterium]HZW54367.1 CPBP family intramembrane glutamic endopeptidase [Candidatus Elarobacter sp.]